MSTRFADIAGSILIPGIIPTGNLLWVDAVNGNDSLAVRGRLSVPFKTLTAAKNAAVAGDTIIVMPSTYNENKLLKHLVNWHFLPGAIVSFSKAESGAIFDTSVVSGNCNSVVAGMGEFNVTNSEATGHIINLTAGNLNIEARKMSANAPCVKTTNTTGSLFLNVKEKINSFTNDVIAIQGSSANNIINVHELYTSGGSGLYISGGAVVLSAHSIYASADIAVDIQGGQSGVPIVIRAFEIISQTNRGVNYNTSSGVLLHIQDARIKAGGVDEEGRAIDINSTAASHKIRLFDCTLIAPGDYSIYASQASTYVHCFGGIGQNTAAHGNVQLLGTVSTNANIT